VERDVWRERGSCCRRSEGQEAEEESSSEEDRKSDKEIYNQKETRNAKDYREKITREGDKVKTENCCEKGCEETSRKENSQQKIFEQVAILARL